MLIACVLIGECFW